MCSLRIKDVSIKKKTLSLSGANTKNGRDAVVTIPNHVIELMKELGIFSRPQNYYIFGNNFRPGLEALKARTFSLYWDKNVRKALKLNASYKFYSLKDTGITNMINLKQTCCLLEIRRDIHLSILPIYTRRKTAKKQTAHLSTMKVYFDKMIVGDLLSYNPTFLQITRIALYMHAPIDDVHLKFITFVEHF